MREGLAKGAMNIAEVSWEGMGWLRAGFSGRRGGVTSVYSGKSLNLGWKEEDEDSNVAENRRRFLEAICGNPDGGRVNSLVTVRQVHGDVVRIVRRGEVPLATANARAALEGDGLVTDVPGVMLGIQVADCVPVLVADVRRRVVGAFHAGWRGTVARIVEKGILRMREEYGTDAADLVAAVGPSIGPCCYLVGDEVRSGFVREFRYGAELFGGGASEVESRIHTPVSLNLWEANRRQLVNAGVRAESVTVLGECSACARDEQGERRYFSHRAEQGRAGRMMGVIGIVGEGQE